MTESADFDDVAPSAIAAEPAADDWRDDPAWTLSTYDPDALSERPADRPPEAAELAQPPLWASLYAGPTKILATWFRPATSAPSG